MTEPDRPYELKIPVLNLSVPLDKRAVRWLGVVVVIGSAAWAWTQLRADLLDKAMIPRAQLVQLEEMQRHFAEAHESETPVKRDLKDIARIRYYRSDGCIYVGRLSDDGSIATTLYVVDPNRIPKEKPPEVSEVRDGGLFSTPAYASDCGGRCLNPHPGPFRSWYGERKGDWVQLWRQWEEGCTHFQMWNLAYNYGDSNPDGSPRVTWTCCRPH